MSIGHEMQLESTLGHLPLPPVPVISSDKRPLHRIADVRRRQGISVRSAARRMHTTGTLELALEKNWPTNEVAYLRTVGFNLKVIEGAIVSAVEFDERTGECVSLMR